MKKSRKVFFGWWITIVTSFTSAFTSGLQISASLLFKPIAADLNLDRTGASVASGIGTLVNGGVFALAGWLTDKFGPKWVVFAGTCIASAGMITLYFIQSAWQYYLVWGFVIILGLALSSSIAVDTMLTNWFVRKRGLAFSLRFGIIGITNSAILPLMSLMIESQGWRQTALIWGLLVIACIPLVLIFVKPKRPEYYGWLPDGAEYKKSTENDTNYILAQGQEYAADIQETEYTFKQAVKTRAYWIINVGWLSLVIVYGSFNLHIVPYLTDMGISPIAAGGMIAMMNFFSIPSRILGGIVADRVKKENLRFLMVGALGLMSAGITILILSHSIVGIYFLLVLLGFGAGSYTPLDIFVRGRYFGRKSYGRLQGLAMIVSAPLGFISPIFTGWIYERTGNYNIAFIIFAAVAAIGAVTMCFARAPKPLHPELNTSQIGKIG